ncbi:putative plastid-lipid-associated protein 12, chloroplastic [Canna indica]|uniref:Plastid-lipid-associated protein 12, chloroplastic n=1 Tax=Canna indica TaxID=4628 RepID=A0AAQ3KBZ1_9LILI|nr:putative plastid-lipid-associated protein 12, chloroplastic [Canna indica]
MAVGGTAAARLSLSLIPPPFSGRSSSLTSSIGLIHSRNSKQERRRGCRRPTSFRPVSSSLVEQGGKISFTDPEAALVEALVGIQGRGRAASPRQLQALFFSPTSSFKPLLDPLEELFLILLFLLLGISFSGLFCFRNSLE